MWEIPRYRIRAYLRSVRQTRTRDREKLDRSTIHFKRVKVDLRLGDGFGMPVQVVPARAILNDLNIRGLKIFTQMPLEPGTDLSLAIEQPRYFFVRAKVRNCYTLPYDTRIMSETPFIYRVHLSFQFASGAEQAAVDSYCRQLVREYLYPGR